ncbi:hypothetical protein QBC40DRAFT_330920 [Triangularia verruculosa]|uniref:Uncharacterized protein n=1 Tax=Triangularia verruculosa TaxID=2587418 RepID=A0AAN7AZD1_9PEZI|nr:hypothetical protein QBC40DRAFT_330920 [Triangularia verruculosa]
MQPRSNAPVASITLSFRRTTSAPLAISRHSWNPRHKNARNGFADYEVDLRGIGHRHTIAAAGPQDPRIELGTPLHDDLEVNSCSSLQSSIGYAIGKLEK